MGRGVTYSFTWHLCEVINSSIGYILIILYLLKKKERYRGNGRYINRIVLWMSIFGLVELAMRTFEVYILSNCDHESGIEGTSSTIILIQRFIFILMEYINGFLITLITMSLFVVIVLNITVLELESHEYSAYFLTGLVSLFCTVITFIQTKNIEKDKETLYRNLKTYLNREAITINEVNYSNFFVYVTSFLIVINGILFAVILIKCLFPFGKKYFKSSPVGYVLTLMCYYIIYIIKWIGFLISFSFGLEDKNTLWYSFVTAATALQGFFNLIVFMVKPLYRYSCSRKRCLINKFKRNEKEALKQGEEVSLENYQILESLNEDDDYEYDDKNTQINVIALTLFQMVLCAFTLLTNMGIILGPNKNNRSNLITTYTFGIISLIMIVLICTYFGIISVIKNNLKHMRIYMAVQWISLFIYIVIELIFTYLLLVKPEYLNEKFICPKKQNSDNWESCKTSQISLNLFNFIVMRHIMTLFNVYYLRYYNCNYSMKFKSLIFRNTISDDDNQMKLPYSPNDIYSNPVASDYESTIYLAVDDVDENDQNSKVGDPLINKNKINKIKGKSPKTTNVNAKVFNVEEITSPMNIDICKARYSNCSLNNSVVNATLNSSATITNNSFLGKINNQTINNMSLNNNNFSQETLNTLQHQIISNKRDTLIEDDSSSEQNINMRSTLKNDTNDSDSDSDIDCVKRTNKNNIDNIDNLNNINIYKENNVVIIDECTNSNDNQIQNHGSTSSGSSRNNNISNEAYLDVNYISRNNSSLLRNINNNNCSNTPITSGISYDTLISYKQAQENKKNKMRGINTLSYVDIHRDIEVENDLLKINNTMAKAARNSMSDNNTSFNSGVNNNIAINNLNTNCLFINNKINPNYMNKLNDEQFINANESFSSVNKIISYNGSKSKRSSIGSSSLSINQYNKHLSSNVGNDRNSIFASSIASTNRVRKYTPIVPLKRSKKMDPHGDWWLEMAMPTKISSIQPSIVYSTKPPKPKSRSRSQSTSHSHAHFYTPSINSNHSHIHSHNHRHHNHNHNHRHHHHSHTLSYNSQVQLYSLIGATPNPKQNKSKDKNKNHCHYRIPDSLNRSLNNSQNSGNSINLLNPQITSKYDK